MLGIFGMLYTSTDCRHWCGVYSSAVLVALFSLFGSGSITTVTCRYWRVLEMHIWSHTSTNRVCVYVCTYDCVCVCVCVCECRN